MTSRKGFTLIEPMVAIFIVGILAAGTIPIMSGRIDSAKWSEGKAGAGRIRTALRAFIAEKGNDYNFAGNLCCLSQLGFAPGDLDVRYFVDGDYSFAIVNGGGAAQPTYLITVTSGGAAEHPTVPGSVALDDAGTFVEIP